MSLVSQVSKFDVCNRGNLMRSAALHIEKSALSSYVGSCREVACGELRSFVVADATGGVLGIAAASNDVQRSSFKRHNAQKKRFS